jgi:glycosyltransferase AglD
MKKLKWMISILIICLFIGITYYYLDLRLLFINVKRLFNFPLLTISVLMIYLLSFCLKAIAWKFYLNNRARFSTCLIGILYSLLINHLVPIKVGDFIRVAILNKREKDIPLSESLQSVIVLRMIDISCLLSISLLGLMLLHIEFHIPNWILIIILIGICLVLITLSKRVQSFIMKQFRSVMSILLTVKGLILFLFVFVSWLLEAAILFGTAWMVVQPVNFIEAIWVNSMTVSGQIFQITPGGIANYETFMSVSLSLLDIGIKEAFSIALITHGLKFLFSYIAGFLAVVAYPITFKTLKFWVERRGLE